MLTIETSRHAGNGITVEMDDDGLVSITLEPDATPSAAWRQLTPLEARELAAALIHWSREADRR